MTNAAIVRHETFPKITPRLDSSWVVFLLLSGRDNEAIRERLVADGLLVCSDEELEAYRREITPPANFQPGSETHLASRAFEQRHHLEVLFRPNATEADAVLQILRRGRVREFAEAALLVGVPLQAVVHVMRERLSFRTTPTTLLHYGRIFFDIENVPRTQLRVLVEQRVREGIQRVAGDDRGAVRRAVAADARVVAVSMASSKLAWAAVLLAFGWPPPMADLATSIGELETLATVRAHEATARAGRDDDRRALGFIAVAAKAQEMKSAMGPTTATIREALAVRLATQDEPTVTVGELIERGDTIGTAEPCPADEDDTDSCIASDLPKESTSHRGERA